MLFLTCNKIDRRKLWNYFNIIGIAVGSLGTTYWLGKQIKELKSIILDKRMIVNLLKQALKENKPKRNYKRKYSSNSRSKNTTVKKVNKTVKA